MVMVVVDDGFNVCNLCVHQSHQSSPLIAHTQHNAPDDFTHGCRGRRWRGMPLLMERLGRGAAAIEYALPWMNAICEYVVLHAERWFLKNTHHHGLKSLRLKTQQRQQYHTPFLQLPNA